jgi:hypothetical protein
MRPVRRADNLTTFMCRLSRNLGASASWNPKGLSGPVMGLLFFFFLWFLYSLPPQSKGTKSANRVSFLSHPISRSFSEITDFMARKSRWLLDIRPYAVLLLTLKPQPINGMKGKGAPVRTTKVYGDQAQNSTHS